MYESNVPEKIIMECSGHLSLSSQEVFLETIEHIMPRMTFAYQGSVAEGGI